MINDGHAAQRKGAYLGFKREKIDIMHRELFAYFHECNSSGTVRHVIGAV